MKQKTIRVALVLTTVALLGVPLAIPHASPPSRRDFTPSTNTYGHVDGVPYVWQEINGYCYWSCVSMALQYIDVPYDLYQFFAASGVGFSAAYIMIDEAQLFLSGSAFRQQQQLPIFCDLLGIDHLAYFDSNSEWIGLLEPAWVQAGVNIELLDGSEAAFQQLRSTLDEGYPVIVWVDPYWLPAIDYIELRDFISPVDPSTPNTGHAIVVIGYNDTAQTVEIMDPGVGAFGSRYGYPDDGRWYYTANYSTLDLAWNAFAYGQVAFTPGEHEVQNREERIGNMIVDRLFGNRTLCGPDLEELFFASFGEVAFRGLSLDMTVEGIKNYLDGINETIPRENILVSIGVSLETYLSLEYPAYRGALEALPSILPSYDVSRAVELGRTAYRHMAALTTNDSLVSLDYRFDGTLLASTFIAIADSYATSGDIDAAIEAHSSEVEEIANHLFMIAEAWKATGEALERTINGGGFLTPQISIAVLGATSALLIVVVIMRRRGK